MFLVQNEWIRRDVCSLSCRFPLMNLQDAGGVNDHEKGEPGKPMTANIMFGAMLPCTTQWISKRISTRNLSQFQVIFEQWIV